IPARASAAHGRWRSAWTTSGLPGCRPRARTARNRRGAEESPGGENRFPKVGVRGGRIRYHRGMGAEPAGGGWRRAAPVLVVALAIATALGTLKADSAANRVILLQEQASDTWAFYQAKAIKHRITELEAHLAHEPERTTLISDTERYHQEELVLRGKAEG